MKLMATTFSILINTCDKYDDCWVPFFTLFKTYWPNCRADLFLNTEYKQFEFDGLNIVSTKVCERKKDSSEITWSECLQRALDDISSEVVLYLQEDYFLKSVVDDDEIEKLAKLMNGNNDIHCIHLTDQAVKPQSVGSEYEGLYPVVKKQRYKVSCQAALWRKDVLRSYLRKHESAWQFEEYGSIRSGLLGHNFYVVDTKKVVLDQSEIIPYVFTGIFQGRWMKHVVPLFAKHNIEVNFSIRGFIEDAPKRQFIDKFKYFWKNIPAITKSRLEILSMYFTAK
jgi:hypothetical protein